MEVILLKNVNNLGRKGDIIRVSEGYARNYLFPQRLALSVDGPESKKLQRDLLVEQKKAAARKKKLQSLASELRRGSVEFKKKATDGGHLYAGVTAREIADKLDELLGIQAESDKIEIPLPIKSVGEHQAIYKEGDQKIIFKINVKAF